MTEYYPLLAKALANLQQQTPEARHSVFERSRIALLKRLRNLQPPLSEEDIEIQRQALEEAILRLEAEYRYPSSSSDFPDEFLDEEELPPSAGPIYPEDEGYDEEHLKAQEGLSSYSFKRGSQEFIEEEERGGRPLPLNRDSIPQELKRPRFRKITQETSNKWRYLVLGGVTLLGIGCVALTAFLLRDKPADLLKQKNHPPPASDIKVAERVGDSQTAFNPATLKAGLILQSLEDPNKPESYHGQVSWRLQNAHSGEAQTSVPEIYAQVLIPKPALKMTMILQRNDDPQLSASHMIRFIFEPGPNGEVPNIVQLALITLRADKASAGTPLAGLVAPVETNSFLVGLSQAGGARERNIELLTTRQWFDIVITLSDGRKAKITFEKGPEGTKVIEDAFAAWK